MMLEGHDVTTEPVFSFVGDSVWVVPVTLVFLGSIGLFCEKRSLSSMLQLVGAGCCFLFGLVNFLHVLQLDIGIDFGFRERGKILFPYLSLLLAIGAICFTAGYLVSALSKR